MKKEIEMKMRKPPIEDDIPFGTARRAYFAASMDPERLGKQVRQDYVRHLQAVRDKFSPMANTDEKLELLDTEMEEYRQGYKKRTLALLSATSRTASPMVTGRANFPVARNRKAMDQERGLYEEMKEWKDKAQRAIHRKLGPTARPLEEQLADADALQKRMKAANRIIRKDTSDEAKIEALAKLGIEKPTSLLEPDFSERPGYPSYKLTNNNAKIRRLRNRIEELAISKGQVTTKTPFEGGHVVDNVEDNRIQIFYDAKPSVEIRQQLKSHGFRWAPSIGTWQRQRTANARAVTGRIVGTEILEPDEALVQHAQTEGY